MCWSRWHVQLRNFGLSLQANCHFPNHKFNRTDDAVADANGMLNQVPLTKHKKPVSSKNDRAIHPNITKDNVLPVVLVRDPHVVGCIQTRPWGSMGPQRETLSQSNAQQL
jgi:hypothetical protein